MSITNHEGVGVGKARGLLKVGLARKSSDAATVRADSNWVPACARPSINSGQAGPERRRW